MKDLKIDRILVTGSVAYDEIMDFPQKFVDFFHPEKLHQINVSFVVDRLEKQLGGTGTNIAYNLSLITKKKIFLLAGVGKDGQDFLDFFKKNQIDTQGILFDKKLYCATGKVITDKNDNQIWGFYYGACTRGKEISLKKYITTNSFAIISANHPSAFLHFQKEAIKYKMPYLYDPGMSLTWIKDQDLFEGINHARFLAGNDYEIAMIEKRVGKKVKEIVKNKNIAIITTLGNRGVKFDSIQERHYFPSYPKGKIVDPTGAGDAWRSGFIAGLAENKSIATCLRQGNALASFVIETYGTVNHRPTKKQIDHRINVISELKN